MNGWKCKQSPERKWIRFQSKRNKIYKCQAARNVAHQNIGKNENREREREREIQSFRPNKQWTCTHELQLSITNWASSIIWNETNKEVHNKNNNRNFCAILNVNRNWTQSIDTWHLYIIHIFIYTHYTTHFTWHVYPNI